MKVEVSMTTEDKFTVETWWATRPEYVVMALRQHLLAATAIWPELAAVRIDAPDTMKAE